MKFMIYHEQFEFIQGMQDQFNVWKSIIIIHCIGRIKSKSLLQQMQKKNLKISTPIHDENFQNT